MPLLFAYGTLQEPDVQLSAFGRRLSGFPDALVGFERTAVPIALRDPERTYDAVVPSFDVPDRAAALARLRAAGCTFVPVGPHAPGEVYVKDPFGVVFDVIERLVAERP
jgi:hypothetical protein